MLRQIYSFTVIVSIVILSPLWSYESAQLTALLNDNITEETQAYIRIPVDPPKNTPQKTQVQEGWSKIKGAFGQLTEMGGEFTNELLESPAGKYLNYLNPNEYIDKKQIEELIGSIEFKEFLRLEELKGSLGIGHLQEQMELFDLNELMGLRFLGISIGEFLSIRKESFAPIELQVFPEYYLATTRFYANDIDQLNEMLQKKLNVEPLYLSNSQGFGGGIHKGNDYAFYFDDVSGRFILAISAERGARNHLYRYLLNYDAKRSLASFKKIELQVDNSQRDFMLWVSTITTGETFSNLNKFLIKLIGFNLEEIKNNNIQSLTLGRLKDMRGSHLSLIVETPMNQYLNYPTINPDSYTFKVQSNPIKITAFSLPSADMIQGNEEGLMGAMIGRNFNKLKEAVKEGYDINITKLFNIFGPEVATYSNRTGSYTALKLKDHAGYQQLMSKLDLNALKKNELDENITQYILENKLKDLVDDYLDQYKAYAEKNGSTTHDFMANKAIPWALKKTGFYRDIQLNFQQQDDWVFVSFLPNGLMERKESDVYLNQWLYYQSHFNDESVYGMIYNLNEADKVNSRYYHRFLGIVEEKINMRLSALQLKENAQIELAVYLDPQFIGVTATYDLTTNDVLYLIVNYNIAYLFWIPRIAVYIHEYYQKVIKEPELDNHLEATLLKEGLKENDDSVKEESMKGLFNSEHDYTY